MARAEPCGGNREEAVVAECCDDAEGSVVRAERVVVRAGDAVGDARMSSSCTRLKAAMMLSDSSIVLPLEPIETLSDGGGSMSAFSGVEYTLSSLSSLSLPSS